MKTTTRSARCAPAVARTVVSGFALALATSLAAPCPAADDYRLAPESLERPPGTPEGRVERFDFAESEIFSGTRRACWVYIPAQYDGSEPAALMVFQDGHAYVSTTGQIRVPIVFDNLIAKGEMPVTVGLFVNPGHRGDDESPAEGWGRRDNRSFEYDSLGDAYARFLIDELIPFTAEKFDLRLTDRPERRAICGMSSGGICAFTAAWERPDYFRKVLSHIGSFVNIRGGHVYPAIIRKTDRKPIRVFLQDGSNDLNNAHGNWPLGNLQLASALAFSGYDFRFVYGDGAHNGKHGGAIFPDSLRWLWRPEVEPLDASAPGGEGLASILPEGEDPGDWELVSEGHGFTDALSSDAQGDLYFSDLPEGTLYRVPAEGGSPEVFLEGGPKVSGLGFGADGTLYAAVQGSAEPSGDDRKRIVAIDPETRSVETVADDVQPNDLAVSRSGWIYFTDTRSGTVVRVPTSARDMSRPPPIAGGIDRPNGIALTADERHLVVSEHGGTSAWTFVLDGEGELRGGERTLTLRTAADQEASGGDGLAIDAAGRPFVTSHVGIQVFDRAGHLSGVIPRPQEKATVSCAFAGPERGYLYVASSDRIYRRRTLTRGAAAGAAR